MDNRKSRRCDCCAAPTKPNSCQCEYCGVYFESESHYQGHNLDTGNLCLSGYVMGWPYTTGAIRNLSGMTTGMTTG